MQKLSMTLGIESEHCFELFISFLLSEFSGSQKTIAAAFSCEKNTHALLSQMVNFYYNERLFSLFCLKQILCNNLPSSKHPYREIFSDFIASLNAQKEYDLFKCIISQLESLANSMPETLYEHSHYMTDDMKGKISDHLIRERLELTQMLLLISRQFPFTTEKILKMRQVFSEFPFSWSRTTDTIAKITVQLESILLLQSFQLSQLRESIENEKPHILLDSPSHLKELDLAIRNLNSNDVNNGIIFLGWILVRSWEMEPLDANESTSVIKSLGAAFIRLKVFDALCLFFCSSEFEEYFKPTLVGSYLKQTIATCLNELFTLYQMEQMVGENSTVLFDLMSVLLEDGEVVKMTLIEKQTGLMTIVNSAIAQFARVPSILTKMVTSIASTGHVSLAVKVIQEITHFRELLHNSSPAIQLTSEGLYVSKMDRMAKFASSSVTISKGITGQAVKFDCREDTVVIEWTGVHVNGWVVLSELYKDKINSISSGHFNFINDQNDLEFLIKANKLSASVLKLAQVPFEVKEMIKAATCGLQLLARFPKIPRKFVASALSLLTSHATCNPNEASSTWHLVQQLSLLPVLIASIKDPDRLLSGKHVSSSVIGRTIVSEECIEGQFDLTISFLNLISTFFDLIPIDEPFIASIVYIFTEIFPSHHLWHIHDDKGHKIGYYCYTIAHKILALNPKTGLNEKVLTFVRKILLMGAPGETLLKRVRVGNSLLQSVIKFTGTDASLSHHEIVSTRLCLSILNQVLRFQEHSNRTNASSISTSTSGATSCTSRDLSTLEKALFTGTEVVSYLVTAEEQNEKNMLFILVGYLFQPFDFRLTVFGSQVLKRLARTYPRSMLACLGSAGDAVKEHILFRLDAVTEDIRVKISLLQFLSVCIQHQPGLIELFVETGNNNVSSSGDKCTSLLQIVLSILEECKEGKLYTPVDLHAAALRFVSTLWMQSNMLTIAKLKEEKKLWDVLLFPIIPSDTSQAEKSSSSSPSSPSPCASLPCISLSTSARAGAFSSSPSISAESSSSLSSNEKRIFPYLMHLLAREIFFAAVSKTHLDTELERRLKGHLSSHLEAVSTHIRETCIVSCIEEFDETFHLISGWKDIIIATAKFEPVEITSKVKGKLYLDLIASFNHQLKLKCKSPVLSVFSDTCLIAFQKWSGDAYNEGKEEWFNIHTSILYHVTELKDDISISLLTSIQALMAMAAKFTANLPKFNSQTLLAHELNDWICPVGSLLSLALRLLEKMLSDSKPRGSCYKLLHISISFFITLLTMTDEAPDVWINYLRTSTLLDSLSRVTLELLQHRTQPRLVSQLILVFVSISSNEEGSGVLRLSGSFQWVALVMKIDRRTLHTESSRSPWCDVYLNTLRFIASMVINCGSIIIRDIIQLVTIHLDTFIESMRSFRQTPSRDGLIEFYEVLRLIHLLAYKFSQYWIANYSFSLEMLLTEASATVYIASAFADREILLSEGKSQGSSSKPVNQDKMVRLRSFLKTAQVYR